MNANTTPTIVKLTAVWNVPEIGPVEVEITDTCKEERKAWVKTEMQLEFYVSYDQIDQVTAHNEDGTTKLLGKPKA